MPNGLRAFKDDGTILFDTNYITYGLLKSGPLELTRWWGFHDYRSNNLDPNSESSYQYGLQGLTDPICSITVYDSISPIVFVAGAAAPCGETLVGNARTFLFRGVEPGARAYVFDVMRDLGGGAGMRCFDASGRLTFTTDMPPLNIVHTVQAPPPSPRVPNAPQYDVPNGPVYIGGSGFVRPKNWSASQVTEYIGYIDIGHPYGDSAAYINFTRSCGYGANDTSTVTSGQEGCGGQVNSVRFFFGQGAVATRRFVPNPTRYFWDVPRDRLPTALIIRTSDYPYPFR